MAEIVLSFSNLLNCENVHDKLTDTYLTARTTMNLETTQSRYDTLFAIFVDARITSFIDAAAILAMSTSTS